MSGSGNGQGVQRAWAGGAGGQGTKTPWSFFHACDGADSLGLAALSGRIPDEWVDWRHGGKRKPERMHGTVLLNMTGPAHLQRLQRLARDSGPVQVTVRELFCERVDRIKDAEVYCIGAALASPGLRGLKDAWASEEPEGRRRTHVPYDSEGHISVAYIRDACRLQAERFVQQNAVGFSGGARRFTVDHLAYQDAWGKESAIPLLGAAAAEDAAAPELSAPPAKKARWAGGGGGGGGQPMEIDGSVLEGGGQILRMSAAYAAIFRVPVHIVKIRAGRKKPGLAAQHLESLRLVRDVSGGSLENDHVGSCDVRFTPGGLAPGEFSADPGTAGAVALMVQASLLPLSLAGGESVCELRGGTDVGFSPPLGFLERVLAPVLARMGAPFQLDCRRRGFFPRGGGHVQLSIPGLGAPLVAVDIAERGDVECAEVLLHATQALGRDEREVIASVQAAAKSLAPQVQVTFSQAPAPERTWKYWVDVVVTTTGGSLFHGGSEPKDLPWPSAGGGNLARQFAAATQDAMKPLTKQLASGAAVDEHLCDQLILPASLAAGTSRLLAAEPSLHTKTAIHIAKLMVPGVRVNEERRGQLVLIEIEGIGHPPGCSEGTDAPPAATEQEHSGPRTVAPPRQHTPAPREGGAPAPAASAPGAPDTVRLRRGSLSAATPELLRDFENDMGQLLEATGVEVVIDAPSDSLVLRGGPEECKDARASLDEILKFYSLSD